jgi:hypothetical protein
MAPMSTPAEPELPEEGEAPPTEEEEADAPEEEAMSPEEAAEDETVDDAENDGDVHS